MVVGLDIYRMLARAVRDLIVVFVLERRSIVFEIHLVSTIIIVSRALN